MVPNWFMLYLVLASGAIACTLTIITYVLLNRRADEKRSKEGELFRDRQA